MLILTSTLETWVDPAWLSGSDTLPIYFVWISAYEHAGSRYFAFVGAVEISSSRLPLICDSFDTANVHLTLDKYPILNTWQKLFSLLKS